MEKVNLSLRCISIWRRLPTVKLFPAKLRLINDTELVLIKLLKFCKLTFVKL